MGTGPLRYLFLLPPTKLTTMWFPAQRERETGATNQKQRTRPHSFESVTSTVPVRISVEESPISLFQSLHQSRLVGLLVCGTSVREGYNSMRNTIKESSISLFNRFINRGWYWYAAPRYKKGNSMRNGTRRLMPCRAMRRMTMRVRSCPDNNPVCQNSRWDETQCT